MSPFTSTCDSMTATDPSRPNVPPPTVGVAVIVVAADSVTVCPAAVRVEVSA